VDMTPNETTPEVQELPSTLRKQCVSTDPGEQSKNDNVTQGRCYRVCRHTFMNVFISSIVKVNHPNSESDREDSSALFGVHRFHSYYYVYKTTPIVDTLQS
jgi:hypothetical protein